MIVRDPDDIVDVQRGDPVEVLIDDQQNAIAWRRAPDGDFDTARADVDAGSCSITLDTTSSTS